MWAAEFHQRIRLAYKGEADDDLKAMRHLAYVNYHIIGVNSDKEMPPYIRFLRERGLTDEVQVSPEEFERRRANLLQDIDNVVDQRLAASGQRKLSEEELAALREDRKRRYQEKVAEAQRVNQRLQYNRVSKRPDRQSSPQPTELP